MLDILSYMIDPILTTALNSINNAMQKASEHATNISNFDNLTQDALVNDIVGLKGCEHQVKASAKLIKVTDEMTKSLLDILA